jgi:hypothetical protein
MLKLPFYIDSPLADGGCALALSLLFAFLYWASRNDRSRIGGVLNWYLERRFGIFDREKARKVGQRLLLALALLFGGMGLFGMSVGVGFLRNGDPPKPTTIEEFLKQHRN